MEYQNRVTMSIKDWLNYADDDNIEFAFGKVDFLSNKPNSHKHIYSEEVIKEYAPTVLGKWVVAEYNKYTSDATTHTDNEVIVGYVPLSQEVAYRYDVDGYLVASVDVIISKLYATNVYEMFKAKNYKSVSIEELVNFTEETKDIPDGQAEKIIESFNVCGITILGDIYNPSVPNANIQLTRMSDEESNKQFENAYITYSEKHNKDNGIDKIDIVLSKLESIERIIDKENLMKNSEKEKVLNSTDEQVEKVVNAEEQNVENSEEQVVDNADCGEDEGEAKAEENAESVDNACGEEATENACGEDEKVENAEDDKEEDDAKDDDAKEVDNSEVEMAELQTKLSEAEAKIASYESELAELRTFKEDVQNSEKVNIANETLEKIKSFISEADYAEYEKEFENCSYAEVGALKNSILAKYVDVILEKSQNAKEDTEIVDYGIPVSNSKVESIYD